ncbi:putative mucin/carbohydrate-binding domain-containing protein [Pseudomonas sp. LB3P14]
MKTWTSSTHTVYSLQPPTWLTNAGLSKGINHDKQSLGVIVEAGTDIRIKHGGTSSDSPAALVLLNNDRETEAIQSITEKFTELTVAHTSVPFINTPYKEDPLNIEITVEYSRSPLSLPTYQTNTDTATFFKLWDDEKSAFALITSQYVDILVPQKDKAHLKELHQSTGLASLINYYKNIFEIFNTLAGLSFSADQPTDQNIPNRFFMKADKNGPGSAYYRSSHIGITADSVAYFLAPFPQRWGTIHEIGHGHEGLFMLNSEIPLFESWNNVYAHLYQVEALGDDILNGSLYQGKPEALFDLTEKTFEENQPIIYWGAGLIFYYLILIMNKSGPEALTEFNKAYRILCNKLDSTPEDISFIDLLAEACENTSHIDIAAFLRFGHVKFSRIKNVLSRYSNRKPVYPLYKLIPKEKIDDIQKQLNLISRLDLVDTRALKITGLTGTIELILDKILFQAFSNQDFLLKHGSNLSTIMNITSERVLITDIPIGIYSLQAPSANNGKPHILTHYIEVKPDTTNTIKIEYEYLSGIKLASQKIHLHGMLGQFATIDLECGNYNITVNIGTTMPHRWLTELYASIIIKDSQQQIIFQKDIRGDNTTPSTDKIPVNPDYTMELYHRETMRPNKIVPKSDLVLHWENTSYLTITPQGLYNKDLDTPVGENLKSTIEYVANILRSEPHSLLHRNHSLKDEIYAAIDSFDDTERDLLQKKYKDIYLTHQNTEPTIVTASSFTWHQGARNGDIAKIDINLKTETIDIEVFETIPDSDFTGIYLAIWIYNETGNVLFCQELYGNITAEHTLVRLPFKKNYEVSVFHWEPKRSPIINMETSEQYEVMQRHCVRALTANSLQI